MLCYEVGGKRRQVLRPSTAKPLYDFKIQTLKPTQVLQGKNEAVYTIQSFWIGIGRANQHSYTPSVCLSHRGRKRQTGCAEHSQEFSSLHYILVKTLLSNVGIVAQLFWKASPRKIDYIGLGDINA
jgi:hypothetical protein